jgi:hypothetical protein
MLDDIDEKKFQKQTRKLEKIIKSVDNEMLVYIVNKAIREMDYREMIRNYLEKKRKK